MNDFSCLDLPLIKKQISELAAIFEAKQYIANEEVIYNPLVIKTKLNETNEALKILKEGNIVSFDGIYNVCDLLQKAHKSITLSGIELLKISVFHNHCARIKKQFTNYDRSLLVRDYTDSINLYNSIFEKIENCIDNTGEIKLDCTDTLRRICSELEQCEKSLYSKAHQFLDRHTSSLQEPAVYERNNRVCFLIKNSDKNKYGGYTYGTSSSGLACYVEPNILVELNNQRNKLIEDKEYEMLRILKHLTYILDEAYETYIKNFDSLVKLNIIFAKAYYGFNHHGVLANISINNYFDLKDICHPLIDEKKVVSNNYRLFYPYKGIVISGSNTGGKTVSLKLIGLAVILSYLGIPLIASEAYIPIYDNVLVDIDDNQSIQDSLSTFSSHIANINDILNNASSNSLILIDELVSGTDPKQAQAISLAIIDKIKELGSTFVITTHYDDIKNYSYNDNQILLSSVGFNMDTLSPTYKYLEDSVGSSNALEIASRYLSDLSIIDKASYYLKMNQSKEDELINKLAKSIEENENNKEYLANLINDNNKIKLDLSNKLKSFDKEKQILKDKYLNELKDYVDDLKEKTINKLNSLNKKEDIIKVKNIDIDLDDNNNDILEQVISIGDNVRIKDNEQIGKVIDIRNDLVSVDVRGLKVKVNASSLIKMPKVEIKKEIVNKPKYSRVSNEINLVGQRVEDGLIMMEEYLDKANGAMMSSVKVIHGIGTGVLRSALREKMKKLKYIDSFHDGDFYDGGSAVTIVEFKK